jgi:arylformamidase
MSLDLEAEYNNQRRVPEHPEIQARWNVASAAYREHTVAHLDLKYGPGERNRYDLFVGSHAASQRPPLVVYIHGGYWQRGDKSMYSFVARYFNAIGIAVAIPTYTLCPAVTIGQIIDELRLFLAVLWRERGQRAVVVGHSAGGHLAACLVATDWQAYDKHLPPDLVRAGYALSGVFDLAPLIPTSLNAALNLNVTTARDVSPQLWPVPPKDRVFAASVGATESAEFHRQSLDLARVWSGAGVKAEYVVVPSANHFTIVDELAKSESAMVAQIATMARLSAEA